MRNGELWLSGACEMGQDIRDGGLEFLGESRSSFQVCRGSRLGVSEMGRS